MKRLSKLEVIETILNQNHNDMLQLEVSMGYLTAAMTNKKGKIANKSGLAAELAKQQGTLKDKKAYVTYLEGLRSEETN